MPADPSRNQADGRSRVPFVGRQAELARLCRMLEQAHQSRPGLVLVEGAAGIGKSALVHQFLDQVGERCVLQASGEEGEASLALGILDQLTVDALSLTNAPAAWSHSGGRPVDPLVAGAALVDMLGELQHLGPVVLVVDDAYWADRPSLHALTFALRRLRVDQVLALVLTRDAGDPRLPEGLRRLLANDHTLRLSLGGLNVGELRALSAQLGTKPLSLRAAARLQAHTDGNPLHARALLEQLPDAAFDAEMPLPAPRSFALLVLSRLATCPADTQALAAAASVLGSRCPLHLAAALAGLADPLPALERLIGAGLLVWEPDIQRVRFPHPLIHAAVYRQLGPTRRAALHTQAAGFAEDESARLRHRTRAASGPDPELATDLTALGRRHVLLGAWEAAAEHLAAAARLTPERADREQLTLEATECQLLVGDMPDTEALTARFRTFRETGWRSYVLARLALVAGRLDESEALLGDAWQRCDPDTEPVLAARVAGQLAGLHVLCGRGQQAADWGNLALRLAPEQTATEPIQLIPLLGLGMTGQAEAALASLDDLPAPAAASVTELDRLFGRARLRGWTDDLEGGYQDLTGILNVAHDRSVPFRLLASANLAEIEYRLGRWDDATVHSEIAVSIAVDADQAWLAPLCHATAALVPAARGQWAQAGAHVDAALASTRNPDHTAAFSYTATAAAHLATAQGDPEQVVAALRPVLAMEPVDGVYEPGILAWQDLLVDALTALGEHEQAQAILVPFEARAADRQRHSTMAAAARARGNLLAAQAQSSAAAAAFQAGLDHAAQVDRPFDRALLELAYGAFLRRTGKRVAAATQLAAAWAVFERLGARPYLERCERELAACGRTRTRRPATDQVPLTPQELAVGRLVVQGLTNRQIARELVVSVKTVEYHLGHVYAKLQVTSRVQLVHRLARD
jgi:ATP/maltotriose-dependent transcriptional regulator MalT